MARHFTVQVGYAGYFANTVTVEAGTLDEALEEGHRDRQPERCLAVPRPLRRLLRRRRVRRRRCRPLGHGHRVADTRRSWRRSRVAFRDQRMEDESGMREACLTAAPDGLRRLPFARAGAFPAHGRGR